MTCHHPEAICLTKKTRRFELDLQEGDEISISSSSSLESLTKPFATDQTPAPVIEISSGSESTPSPPEGIHIIQYFNNDKQMPIHNKPQSGLDTKAIVGLCLSGFDLVCKTKPVSVRMNSVFVIDLNYVSYKSLYADDNGIWETSSPRRYFNAEVNAGIVSEVLSSSK